LPPLSDAIVAAPANWEEFRRQMPIAQRWAYFDHAAVSPLPENTRAALAAWAEDACRNGDTSWPSWARQVEVLRHRFASLLGATPEEIALTRSTTEGIGYVAEGYPWQAGDNVVTLADEFPTNQYPWMHLATRGVECRRVPTVEGRVDLDRMAAACDARTRIVSVSWVSYSSGWRNDLDRIAAIAHQRGSLLLVDAIQGLGVFPLDVRRTPIDFLAADGHKWMLGIEGAGVFYLRREHLKLLRPLGVGWNSVVQSHDFQRIELNFKDSADRYEGGSQCMAGMIALAASLELLMGFGPESLNRRIIHIADVACGRLMDIGAVIASDRSPEHASGIVAFDLPGRDLRALREECLRRGIVLSLRAGKLRISPHAYNNEDDIQRLVEVLQP
jgi:cysteine desulfurase/selenocysteine lyase